MHIISANEVTKDSVFNKPEATTMMPLPSWAQQATQDDGLAQPWKTEYGTDDDPKFDEGEDLFVLYKNGIKACRAEGSLAA